MRGATERRLAEHMLHPRHSMASARRTLLFEMTAYGAAIELKACGRGQGRYSHGEFALKGPSSPSPSLQLRYNPLPPPPFPPAIPLHFPKPPNQPTKLQTSQSEERATMPEQTTTTMTTTTTMEECALCCEPMPTAGLTLHPCGHAGVVHDGCWTRYELAVPAPAQCPVCARPVEWIAAPTIRGVDEAGPW